MKIFSAQQIQRADNETIVKEPIDSIDLMERASCQVFLWLKKTFKAETHFDVVCGPGNNGGDGLAVARMLVKANFSVKIWTVSLGTLSTDNQINRLRLEAVTATIYEVNKHTWKDVQMKGVVIDALFGSGLTRPLIAWVGEFTQSLNRLPFPKVSIDIASGLFAEDNDENQGVIFQPDHTLTFEMEKLAFQFPENQPFIGELKTLPIQLNEDFIINEPTSYFVTYPFVVKLMHQKGSSVAYKNTFGHALIVAGSTGKMGAAVLCAKACLKSGAGLVSAHIPESGNVILQVSVPEIMTISDSSLDHISDVLDVSLYHTIGIGPGLGHVESVFDVLNNILVESKNPIVIDADALNVVSKHKEMLSRIPIGSILTPHLGEWRRLNGNWKGGYDRLMKAKAFCKEHQVFVILKGAKSAVVCPDGEIYFNSTGNSGMATAGSGDVLTGILTGLLAQGYPSKQAAILGVYLHGLAGDIALTKGSRESVIASEIIDYIGTAFQTLA